MYGEAQYSYTYYCAGDLGKWYPEAGWRDDDMELVEDTLDSGLGLMVYADSDCVFPYAGEVNMAETDQPIIEGLQPFGNIRPCDVSVQSIIPVDGDENELGDGAVTLQFLDMYGEAQYSYTYYCAGDLGKWYPEAGWRDDDMELVDEDFTGGNGFMVYSDCEGFLRFPEI